MLFKQSNYWFCLLLCLGACSLRRTPRPSLLVLPVPEESFCFGLNFPPLVSYLFDSFLSQNINPMTVYGPECDVLQRGTPLRKLYRLRTKLFVFSPLARCVLVVCEITERLLFLAGFWAQVTNMTPKEFKHPVSHGPGGTI